MYCPCWPGGDTAGDLEEAGVFKGVEEKVGGATAPVLLWGAGRDFFFEGFLLVQILWATDCFILTSSLKNFLLFFELLL